MDTAYTAVVTENGYFIGRADRNVAGYTPCDEYGALPTWDRAQELAAQINEGIGVSATDAIEITLSSMFAPSRHVRP